MTLKQPTPAPDDPRLKGHETTYQASRGGWFPRPVQSTEDTKKKEK